MIPMLSIADCHDFSSSSSLADLVSINHGGIVVSSVNGASPTGTPLTDREDVASFFCDSSRVVFANFCISCNNVGFIIASRSRETFSNSSFSFCISSRSVCICARSDSGTAFSVAFACCSFIIFSFSFVSTFFSALSRLRSKFSKVFPSKILQSLHKNTTFLSLLFSKSPGNELYTEGIHEVAPIPISALNCGPLEFFNIESSR
mmetsp:Transcript_12199/g.13905  ORF Transcript_12199/g.13905 Transcript_12199/m.13905 type:complete len:204 (+) Transcript_12199:865-1476(+)